jgi:hypothetical protein
MLGAPSDVSGQVKGGLFGTPRVVAGQGSDGDECSVLYCTPSSLCVWSGVEENVRPPGSVSGHGMRKKF